MGYTPHRYQLVFHTAQARERYDCAGRRGGKTEGAAQEAGAYMLGPYRVCLLGPTYNDVYKEFRVIRDFVRHPAYPWGIDRLVDNKDNGNLIIKTSIGAELEARSAANITKSPVIGEEYDLLILSEGAKINGLGGEGGLWESQLRGNLTTRLGDLIVPTTPAGKDDWLYPRFLSGLKGDDPERFAIQFPAFANPIYYEDLGRMYRLMSRRAFREQVLGDFVSWTGAIWTEDCGWDERRHIIKYFRPPAWWNRVEIIDPGWSDDLAWAAAVIDHLGRVYIVDEFSMKKTSYEAIASHIIQRRRMMYGKDDVPNMIPVYVDPEDPRCAYEISKAATEMGELIATTPADNDVTNGFLMASARIRSNMLYLTNNCVGIAEALGNHEWSGKENTRGKVEKRDRYKHYSDLIRYLQLASLRPSILPLPITTKKETFEDMLNGNKQKQQFGMGVAAMERLYKAA
ncbi:hypothetical protein LCGC14_0578270 [marine sediment metagenome]|uniref:Terminase large subunit gp17-like C-terminal domain-containing protein n=1 Tax=marine sediment metagenome TaxID=412755 RepID=A0A0F9U3I1_9ZZZZ